MPLELLHHTAAHHGVVKGGSISPLQAYEIARDMHVSYRAIAFQLVNSHFIGASTREQLLRVQTAKLKTHLPMVVVHRTRGGMSGRSIKVRIHTRWRCSSATKWCWDSGAPSDRQPMDRGKQLQSTACGPPATCALPQSTAFASAARTGNVTALRATDATEPVLAKVARSFGFGIAIDAPRGQVPSRCAVWRLLPRGRGPRGWTSITAAPSQPPNLQTQCESPRRSVHSPTKRNVNGGSVCSLSRSSTTKATSADGAGRHRSAPPRWRGHPRSRNAAHLCAVCGVRRA